MAPVGAQFPDIYPQHFLPPAGKFLQPFFCHAPRHVGEALLVFEACDRDLNQPLQKQSTLRGAPGRDPALLQCFVGFPPVAVIEKIDPVQVFSTGWPILCRKGFERRGSMAEGVPVRVPGRMRRAARDVALAREGPG